MPLRGVIFDLDGTLGDTLPVCYAAFRQVFQQRLGRTYTNEEIHAQFGPSEEGVISALVPDDAGGAFRDYLSAYRTAHRQCPRPFLGIREVLESLRDRGIRLAVVTGKGPRSAEISLDILGLADYFQHVIAGSAQGAVKPDAMRTILQDWQFAPAEALSVGDAPSDVHAAHEVGLVSAAAAWAPGTDPNRLREQCPNHLFGTVASFQMWLESELTPPRRRSN